MKLRKVAVLILEEIF